MISQTNHKDAAQLLIDFYKNIPDEDWTTDRLVSSDCKSRCAVGHVISWKRGDHYFKRSYAADADRLITAIRTVSGHTRISLSTVNDKRNARYQGPTPKARVLAYLRDVVEGRL